MIVSKYFDDWKCRCSSLHRIAVSLDRLTEKQNARRLELLNRAGEAAIGKAKPLTDNMEEELAGLMDKFDSRELPQGVKTFLREEWIRYIHGRERQIESKYTKKGTTMEENALTLVSEVEGKFHKKNTEELENDYIKGTPDSIDGMTITMLEYEPGKFKQVRVSKAVDDTKCAWDIFTYYAATDNSDDDGKEGYEFQIQGYCALTGAPLGRIRRCLLDTPQPLLEAEKLRLKLKLGVIDGDGPGDDAKAYREGCAEIERAGKYEHDIPAAARLHTTVIERNDKLLAKLYERILDCRDYLNQLHQDYLLKLTPQEVEELYKRLAA